jgi:hypothetical protein
MRAANEFFWVILNLNGDPYPPYLIQIFVKGGYSYYLHSPNMKDDDKKTMTINIYDFRAMDEVAEGQLRSTLDTWGSKPIPQEPYKLHPLLSLGRLRCDLDDIEYCIEWWTRYWTLERFIPKEELRKIGFTVPEK